MTAPTLALLGLALGLAAAPPGRRADLGVEGATLFVPEGVAPAADGTVAVLVHLHGAASVVEPAFVKAGLPGVLVTFNRKGLSSVYAKPFSDPALFPRLLDAALAAAKDPNEPDAPAPRAGRVVVSSFSAGFGGVRELLKVPAHFDWIDGLVMADSLYAGYAGDPARKAVDPALVAGFRRFAAEAAAGRKTFLLTHSAQVPPGYAGTTETADDLVRSVGGAARPLKGGPNPGWAPTRSFERGRFLVLGFPGEGAADHMAHLRNIEALWRRFGALSGAR